MADTATLADYGVLTAPMTLTIERLLPGPIERVWAYLTESDKRGRWLATGEMELRVGGRVSLTWHNDTLTGHAEQRPEGHPCEHRLESTITRLEPPRLLAMGWGNAGEVTFTLEPWGDEVRLVIVHRNLPDRDMLLSVSGGWHAHLDILVAVSRGQAPAPFWSTWQRLRGEYESRLPR